MARVGIFVGTVYRTSLLVAEEANICLYKAGHDSTFFENGSLEDWRRYSQDYVLVVTSTDVGGALPGNIRPLFDSIQRNIAQQPELRYGIIGLGDSGYPEFCPASRRFDELLQTHGASRVGDKLEVDVAEHQEPETVTTPWVEEWASLLT